MRLLREKKNNRKSNKELKNARVKKSALPEIKEPKWHMSEVEINEYCSERELEEVLNELLSKHLEYGDIILKIQGRKAFITRIETRSKENRYFVKVIGNYEMTSTERTIREFKATREIGLEDCLADVTYYKDFRILIFRHEENF